MKTLKKLFYFLLITCGVVLVLAVSCVSNIFLLGTGIYYSFKDTVSQMKDPTKLSAFNQKHNPQMAALGSISWITDDKHLWVNAQGQCECKFPPTDEVRTKSKCKCNAQDVKYIQKQVKESITIETPNRIAREKKRLENLRKIDQKIQSL